MFKKVVCFVLFCLCTAVFTLDAQQAYLETDSNANHSLALDVADSVALIAPIDTISPVLLRIPDSLVQAKILDSLSKVIGFSPFNIDAPIRYFHSKNTSLYAAQEGILLPKGENWVLITILVLIIIFAVLNQIFSKQLIAIIQSFFSNRALSNLNKEDNLFSSWPFLILFVQFGFTIGLFLYLAVQFKELNERQSGFNFYLTISFLIIGFYTLKIVALKLLGFIFNVQKPIVEYTSILYLSYFNASLLVTPLVVAFALSPLKYSEIYLVTAGILLGLIFLFQFIRAGINILTNYRFSKVYLILYFCTLEICPILILIKVIGF